MRRRCRPARIYIEFQSAPLTDVRGDAVDANLDDPIERVSIRSPH